MIGRRGLLTGGVVITVTGLSGCGGNKEKALEPRLEKIRPSALPSPSFSPASAQPIESRLVEGSGFTISIPARFAEQTVEGANGATNYSFTLRSEQPAPIPTTIAVIPDIKPKAGAIEQSFTLEQTLRLDPKAVVTRSEIPWPGTQRAVLLQWKQSPGGTPDLMETWQLMAEVNPSLILNAVATAPEVMFVKEKLADILATFTIKP